MSISAFQRWAFQEEVGVVMLLWMKADASCHFELPLGCPRELIEDIFQ